ncbi:hypothetical protein [Cryptosporangium sp. NPDC051539]|uniref:hypothetical protein n=1 Tax=Cryptosporangium sp. NPDC051539 TaxID=3363962 RepID=UPI003797EC41
MRRTRTTAALAATCLTAAALTAGPPAAAATPEGASGPVIVQNGRWYLRTTPTSGPANLTFNYGRAGSDRDVPVAGDWDGDGHETPGIARISPRGDFPGTFGWHLRNSNTSGPADISFEFGVPAMTDFLRGTPIAGNFDPTDDADEVGYVIREGDSLAWTIRTDLTPTSGTVTFVYGRGTDSPVVGDWDGDGVDTAGVIRGNQWLLTDAHEQGGPAGLSFRYGSADRSLPEAKIVGDWNGDGVDTPGVLRNNPVTQRGGGYEVWLVTNRNASGPAQASFTFGNDSFAFDTNPQATPLFLPRLTIEVT